jgi:type IV pilus assembly protein PilN
MTVRVNLLPHREERRKRARQYFFVLAAGTGFVGLLLIGAVHTFYGRQIETQQDRNKFLKGEIAKLEKDIAEIDELKGKIAALLARKRIIEELQADRAQTVHLLDELVRQMPEGVYLKQLVQKGLRVDIAGYAQSNARVSTLMRNIDSSPWLERPVLIEVKASTVDKKRVSDFSMFLFLKRAVDPKPAATPAAPAAAKK